MGSRSAPAAPRRPAADEIAARLEPIARQNIAGAAHARIANWRASDRGRRLDHVWISPALKGAVTKHEILKDARDWTRPSDHVPIMTEIEA